MYPESIPKSESTPALVPESALESESIQESSPESESVPKSKSVLESELALKSASKWSQFRHRHWVQSYYILITAKNQNLLAKDFLWGGSVAREKVYRERWSYFGKMSFQKQATVDTRHLVCLALLTPKTHTVCGAKRCEIIFKYSSFA